MRETQGAARPGLAGPARRWSGRGALLALAFGAALLSPRSHAAPERETALMPPPMPAASVLDFAGTVPRILSAEDVLHYQTIFMLQERGAWRAADREIAQLSDRILMGYVVQQRLMHPTHYRSRYEELRRWMQSYADHLGAERVHALALRRKPDGAKPPRAPVTPPRQLNFADVPPDSEPTYRSERPRNQAEAKQVAERKRAIRRRVRNGEPAAAEALLSRADSKSLLDPVEYDAMRAQVAAAHFFAGDDEKALQLAAAAAERSHQHVTTADWTAGLAAWRLGQYGKAQHHFERLARSQTASSWNLAAGAYWAARAYLVDRQPAKVNSLLNLAARHPRTFYGLIASRLLEKELRLRFDAPPLPRADMLRLLQVKPVRRAIALVEVGKHDMADEELTKIYLSANAKLGPGLLGLAFRLELPKSQLRLARGVLRPGGERYYAALYPIPPWKPAAGYRVDRALVYALMRQESRFDTQATSVSGARGLMQLMPATARYVAGDEQPLGHRLERLYRPSFNMELAQRYLDHLISDQNVRGNLFHLSAAYNGGPGNLRRWLRDEQFSEDPLLFIESIPLKETRLYVERVLTNLWIYRARLNQDVPSLDAVATGNWPQYFALDGNTPGLGHAEN